MTDLTASRKTALLIEAQNALDEGLEPTEALEGLQESLEGLSPEAQLDIAREIEQLGQVDAWLRAWPEPAAPDDELRALSDVVLQRLEDPLPALSADPTAPPVFDDADAQPPPLAELGPEAARSGAYSLDKLVAQVPPPNLGGGPSGPAPVVRLGAPKAAEEESSGGSMVWLAMAAAVGLGIVGVTVFGGTTSSEPVAMSAPEMQDMEPMEQGAAVPTGPRRAAAATASAAEPMAEVEAETESAADVAEEAPAPMPVRAPGGHADDLPTEEGYTGRGVGGAAGARGGAESARLEATTGSRARRMTSVMAAAMSSAPSMSAPMARAAPSELDDLLEDQSRAASRRTRAAVRACLPADFSGPLAVRVRVLGATGAVASVVRVVPTVESSVRTCIETAARRARLPERDRDFETTLRY